MLLKFVKSSGKRLSPQIKNCVLSLKIHTVLTSSTPGHHVRNEDFLKIYTYNVKSKWSVKNEDFISSIRILIKTFFWEIILSILRMTHRMISFKNNQKKGRKKKNDFLVIC